MSVNSYTVNPSGMKDTLEKQFRKYVDKPKENSVGTYT